MCFCIYKNCLAQKNGGGAQLKIWDDEMKRNTEKKTEILPIRFTKGQKAKLKSISSGRDLPMAEVICKLIDNAPIPDQRESKERFAAIHTLSKEINYIGKNINQIAISLKLIITEKRIQDDEIKRLIIELRQYNKLRTEIVDLLSKNQF